MRSQPRLIVLAAIPLLAAGCGTTVARNAAGVPLSAGTGGNDSLGVPTATPDATAGSVGAVSGPGGPVGAGTGPGTGTGSIGVGPVGGSTGGNTASGGGTAPGGATFAGPGLTATTITVGITYTTNTKERGAALGVTNVNTGDPLAEQKAIIKDINDHGGIAGRKLLYVAHDISATSTATYDQQAQEECSDLTQDHHVFAVLDWNGGDTLSSCTMKAGAVQVSDSAQQYTTASTFQRFPYLLMPGSLRTDRIAATWAQALVAQSYFQKWDIVTGKPGAMPVRVGVLSLDDAQDRYAVEHVLKPALAAAGFPAYQVAYLSTPQSAADSGSTVSEEQSAVLKFRQANITHVLPLDAGAGLSLYFGRNASSQHYYPRYGLNSGDGVQVLLDAGLMPTDQLNGAVGFGWEPMLDIAAGHNSDTGPYSNTARRHCVAVMKKAGVDISGSAAERGALEFCDEFAFFKAAVERGGPSLTRDTFLAGANALAGTFVAGTTFSTSFGPQQHDGVAAYRNFGYSNGCGCFLYTSGLRPIG